MKRTLPLLSMFCLLIAVSACTLMPGNDPIVPSQVLTDVQVEQVEETPLPFLGIWFSEDRTSQLIITETHAYYHEFPSNREVYAEVVSIDLIENTINLRMNNILHSGQQMGFDSPMITVQFKISDETMQFWLSRLTVSNADQPVLYLHDEVLNP